MKSETRESDRGAMMVSGHEKLAAENENPSPHTHLSAYEPMGDGGDMKCLSRGASIGRE